MAAGWAARNIAVAGGGTTSYGLDGLYRLRTVTAPSAADSEAFSYDRLGNRLTATRGGTSIGASSTTHYYVYYPATQTGPVEGYTPIYNDRLKEIRAGSVSGAIDSAFTYDNEGRMTTQTGTTPRSYSWDAKGRLTSEGTETYAYDPLNHRIRRTGGTLGTLDYFLEGEHLESVYKGNKIQEKYFRGLSIDELVAGFTTQNGKLVPFFFQHDQVNSVVAVSKPNGGTQQKANYKAFGEDKAGTGTAVSRLKYTGREDDGSGLYQYRARYYDPRVGRFISEDPKKFEAGVNFYAYVDNNPVNANDPTGHFVSLIPMAINGLRIGATATMAYFRGAPLVAAATTTGVINGVSSGLGTYATSGNVKQSLISTGVGIGTGAMSTYFPAATTVGVLAKAGGVAGLTSFGTQSIHIGVSDNKTLAKDFNWGELIGSTIGGLAGNSLTLKAGTSVAQQASAAVIGFGPSTAIGGAGQDYWNRNYASKPNNESLSTTYRKLLGF
jgi:RHS repeat-associated protein